MHVQVLPDITPDTSMDEEASSHASSEHDDDEHVSNNASNIPVSKGPAESSMYAEVLSFCAYASAYSMASYGIVPHTGWGRR